MVPFAGWEMPVQYEGVIPEHRAVRTDAGVFDVSHMGEIEVEGPTAATSCRRCSRTTSTSSRPGEAQYTLLTNESGGIIDDLIVYRLDATASCSSSTLRIARPRSNRCRERELRGSDVRDVSDEFALLAVQGRTRSSGSACHGKAFTFEVAVLDGVEVMVNRTGYTGEEGVELALHAGGRGRALGRA